MPWKESVIVDERMKFVGRLLQGELSYPFHDRTLTVTNCGRVCVRGKKVNLSYVFAGQNVGVREVADGIWLVTFMDYDLGYFDEESSKLEPLEYPFAPEIV